MNYRDKPDYKPHNKSLNLDWQTTPNCSYLSL